MQDELMTRLEEIRVELDTVDELHAQPHLEALEQIVMTLETAGTKVPAWARARLAARVDEQVEDMFDNMPV